MKDIYLRGITTIARWSAALQGTRYDDRGEINSSVYWTGAMVLLAATIAAVVSGRAESFADGINFGG